MSGNLFTGEEIMEKTRLEESLSKIKHVLIVLSGKGGVGKSTVSSNIAQALSMKGYVTGLMDLDITGPNIAKMFKVEDEKLTVENDKLVPIAIPPSLKVMSMAFLLPDRDSAVMWRGPMKMGAVKQFIDDVNWGDLDYLIIDMPPGTGDEALSIVQLIPKADGMIIVTTPQDVALLDSRKSINFSINTNIPIIGLIENMSGFICPHCGEMTNIFKAGGGVNTAESLGIQFLGKIPIEPEIVSTGDGGLPIVTSNPDSESAKALISIMEKIIKTVEK